MQPFPQAQNYWSNTFGDNGKLIINYDASSIGRDVFVDKATADDPPGVTLRKDKHVT
jgi:hypothetical protein